MSQPQRGHQRRPSQMEQKQLDNAVEIFKDKPEEDKLEALKQIWWELNVHEMERQEFEEEKIQENKKLEEEIERLNLQYGDEVLANIQLNHDKRQSMKLAQRWKEEAEKLREQLELINEEDDKNDITKNDITNDYVDDDSDDMIQGDDDETPGNDLDWEQYIDKIFNSDEEKNLTQDEKIDTLKNRVKKVGVELNNSLEENTKLQKQKQNSLQLAEKWRQEAMSLRNKLENSNNNNNNNNNGTLNSNDYNNSINAPDRKLKQLENVLIEKEEENKKLKHERKESQIAIQSYQQELSQLKKQLFNNNNTHPLNDEDMEDYDNDNVLNENETNDLLYDQETQGNETQGGDTQGGYDGEFEHNTEKLLLKSQIDDLHNQIEALNKENEKLKGLLNNSSLAPDNSNDNEEELNKLNDEIKLLKIQNNKLNDENNSLKNDKINLIKTTSSALEQSRELIRKLGKALQNVKVKS